MAQSVREIMTPNPDSLPVTATLTDAAREMRDRDIGDVIVTENGSICGIVTDRDLTVRAIAEGKDPKTTKLGDICSRSIKSVKPDDNVETAIKVMREQAIRRLPVVQDGKAVGIVSLGDLAVERDRKSALGDISAAPPNN